MSLSLNMAVIAGRLTKDPEYSQTSQGTSNAYFTVAVDRNYAREGQQKADFIPVKAWRSTADFVSKYFRKGSAICVRGEFKSDSWTDREGNPRTSMYVEADDVKFVESKSGENKEQNSVVDTVTPADFTPTQEANDDQLPF